MVGLALRRDVGAVGARLWFTDGTLQHAGVVLGIGGVAGHVRHKLPRTQLGLPGRVRLTQEFSAVTAACMVCAARCSTRWVGSMTRTWRSTTTTSISACASGAQATAWSGPRTRSCTTASRPRAVANARLHSSSATTGKWPSCNRRGAPGCETIRVQPQLDAARHTFRAVRPAARQPDRALVQRPAAPTRAALPATCAGTAIAAMTRMARPRVPASRRIPVRHTAIVKASTSNCPKAGGASSRRAAALHLACGRVRVWTPCVPNCRGRCPRS